jgi:PPM family protein phosphatase
MNDKEVNIEVYVKTDVGMVRAGNEDNYLIADLSSARSWVADETTVSIKDPIQLRQGTNGLVLAVSDGMGGALAGEVASQLAVESVFEMMQQFQDNPSLSQFDFQERLRLAIEQANNLIISQSHKNANYTGMGATFTAAGIIGDIAYLAQVGDSRCYLVRQGNLEQITEDQSLINQLIKLGHVSKEDAAYHHLRNVILQALGAQAPVNVFIDRLQLRQGDVLLLCSDGLTGKVSDEELLQIVRENSDLKVASELLIDLANERGGEDNITIVLARFSGAGLREPSPDDTIKGDPILRDPNLPRELDLSALDIPDEISDRNTEETLKPSVVIEEPLAVPVAEFSIAEDPPQPRSWWRRLLSLFAFNQKSSEIIAK